MSCSTHTVDCPKVPNSAVRGNGNHPDIFSNSPRLLLFHNSEPLPLNPGKGTFPHVLCKTLLKAFIKDNKDRFVDKDVAFLLDMWDSLDLMEERLKTANEDLSDILFGSDE